MGFEKLLKTTINTFEHLSVAAQQYQHHHQQQHSSQQAYAAQSTPQPVLNHQGSSNFAYDGNASYSRAVYPDKDGRLVYPAFNEKGDRLFDFSGAGYNEGWTSLPEPNQIPVVASLDPDTSGGDDATRIQQALDQVATHPVSQYGFRGVLQLNRGTFHLHKPIEIRASGVILQGDPGGGTQLIATTDPLATPYLIKIVGEPNQMNKKRVPVVNEYVPVGHYQIQVRDKNYFKVGDTVLVAVQFNEQWIKDVGMDVIHPKGDTTKNNGWKPGRFEHHRRVVQVGADGTTLTLNEPITTALSQHHGGGFVQSYENKRVQRVGVQNLEILFPANQQRGPDEIMKDQKKKVKDYRFADELFDHLLFAMDHAENCWIRDVRSVWWRNFARLGTNTVAITLKRCQHTFPQGPPPDPRKPAPLAGQFAFEISGQLILIEECHAEYSFHSYSYKGRVPGPNVVYRSTCVAKNGDVGPHMKWSSGQLYDNCNIEGQMIIQDRFDAGSGHGWSGANSVVWNTIAHAGMIVQQPPLGQNFIIGSSSKRAKARVPDHPWAWEESPDKMVRPPSLYAAQLAERRSRCK